MAEQSNEAPWQKIGTTWIQAIVDHDYQRISRLCQVNVRSRLVTPSAIDKWESADDLISSIRGWFGDTSHIRAEHGRVDQVGQKLAINYRLTFQEEGKWCSAEQQVYGSLRDGLMERLDLLCSGFQSVHAPGQARDDAPAAFERDERPSAAPTLPAADALLVFETQSGAAGGTCALLTPAIKARLGEIQSGQVLEVRVNDPEAKADIESWSRLSGNELLAVAERDHLPEEHENLSFYLKKK